MGILQVFGSMRLAGNVIWARPLIEKRHKQRSGTLPADLADAAGHVDTPPDTPFAIDLTVDAVSIGTITISDAGTFTFATTSHEAKALAAGAVVRFVAPDPADSSIAGIAVTLVAALA